MSPPPRKTAEARFRFRPRFKLLAYLAALVGLLLLGATLAFSLAGASRVFAVACGLAGLALGALYLISPTWSIEVAVDDEALEVLSKRDRRFRLPWNEITRVIVSRETSTCFVDGGDPDRSLLVPGPGAPAPYEIENRGALVGEILARAPREVVTEVQHLAEYSAGREVDDGRGEDGAR